MAETTQSKEDAERAKAARIAALIRERLVCAPGPDSVGCGGHLVPVHSRQKGCSLIWWTCPVPGCSKLRADTTVRGIINTILLAAGEVPSTLSASAARYIREYVKGVTKTAKK